MRQVQTHVLVLDILGLLLLYGTYEYRGTWYRRLLLPVGTLEYLRYSGARRQSHDFAYGADAGSA